MILQRRRVCGKEPRFPSCWYSPPASYWNLGYQALLRSASLRMDQMKNLGKFLGVLVCAAAAAQEVDRTAAKAKEDEDRVRERMADFYEQRAFPNKSITPGARLNAFRDLVKIENAAATGKISPRAARFTDQWKFIGP